MSTGHSIDSIGQIIQERIDHYYLSFAQVGNTTTGLLPASFGRADHKLLAISSFVCKQSGTGRSPPRPPDCWEHSEGQDLEGRNGRRREDALGPPQQQPALIDIKRRPAEEIRGPKAMWRAAMAVNLIGPVSYFVVGRRRVS